MPSVFALRAVFGASLGLGALDLVWINAVLAPQLAPGVSPPAIAAATAPVVESPAPAPQPAPPAVEPPPVDERHRVYFATRSATVDAAARSELAGFAAKVSAGVEITLEGHADYRGEEAYNLSLSKARAEAVHAELVRLGVSPDHIHVAYVGEGTASGDELWRDRRVDLQLRGAR